MRPIAPESINIEELLPFFVNGTLDDKERTLVEQALADDEGLRQQVEGLRLIREKMQAAELPQSSGELGLARLMREIDGEAAPRAANSTRPPMLRISGWAAGMAAALALAFMAGTANQSENPVYIQASGGDFSAALTVSFQPEISQKLMAEALLAHSLTIIDGPSASGFYRLESLDEGDLDVIAEVLRAQSAVFKFVDTPQ